MDPGKTLDDTFSLTIGGPCFPGSEPPTPVPPGDYLTMEDGTTAVTTEDGQYIYV